VVLQTAKVECPGPGATSLVRAGEAGQAGSVDQGVSDVFLGSACHRSSRIRTQPVALAGEVGLLIPHYVVLAFLWIAFMVLSVVAFVAILFTGQ
jgi:hypothetical protein